MAYPVDVGADFKAVTDGLEPVTVESLDPDTGAVLATAGDVTALAGVTGGDEAPAGDGAVGFASQWFQFAAADLTFAPKKRDRVTRGDGTKWLVGRVTNEGFGGLYRCEDCTRER